jgi:transcription elongation factor
LYQDGLAFELLPLSLLRILEQSCPDFTPFVLSAMIHSLPSFATSLKCYAQNLVQVGDRILVMLGEHTRVIGQIREIHDEVVNVITKIPEWHSGLIICVSMHGIIPYFLEGDHVKIPWLDHFGMVITVDHDKQKVTFLDNKINTEVCPSLPLPTALIDFCLYRLTC